LLNQGRGDREKMGREQGTEIGVPSGAGKKKSHLGGKGVNAQHLREGVYPKDGLIENKEEKGGASKSQGGQFQQWGVRGEKGRGRRKMVRV